jgi:hypothetical protein
LHVGMHQCVGTLLHEQAGQAVHMLALLSKVHVTGCCGAFAASAARLAAAVARQSSGCTGCGLLSCRVVLKNQQARRCWAAGFELAGILVAL